MEEHPEARQIVETLSKAGFIAYYAGGWVRDLLLKHPSDDIDIATNAPPETVQALFPHTAAIGIAFGIVLVIIDNKQYEVATFRQDFDYQDGRRPSRIGFTTPIEDAKRRDFTINGMFYDPLQNEVLDYVNGRDDLKAKVIRAIGDPHQRIKEDRLRMIRAVRLACRFGFQIEQRTQEAIYAHAQELFPAVAIERVWQEFTKGHNKVNFTSELGLTPMLIMLHDFGLLAVIFPELKGVSREEIKKRLLPVKHYPLKAPTIASILPLFPEFTLQMRLDLCKKLKLSNLDQQFVMFLTHAEALTLSKKRIEKVEWAHFYSNTFSSICLKILSAPLESEQRRVFLEYHEKQKIFLAEPIRRIREHAPLIGSDALIALGIKPGVTMGLLLKEAEKISVNEGLYETGQVIARLKKLPIWPAE